MRGSRPPGLVTGMVAVGCFALAWLLLRGSRSDFDTAYAVAWGMELGQGHWPAYEIVGAPTPHPLWTALGLLVQVPPGEPWPWMHAIVVLAYAAIAVLVLALGRELFGWAAGVVALVVVLTMAPLLRSVGGDFLDVPYVALLLAAALVEVRRPFSRPLLVLALLCLAGLLRPETWVIALVYLAVVVWRRARLPSAAEVALAVLAPVVWLLGDLVATGNPLHSFGWTNEYAAIYGHDASALAGPRLLGRHLRHLLSVPVLVLGAVGVALALRERSTPKVIAVALAVLLGAAFCALTASGQSTIERYALAPACLLAVFAGGALMALWAHRAKVAKVLAVGAVAAFAVLVPGRVEETTAAADDAQARGEAVAALSATAEAQRDRGCRVFALPPWRAGPYLAQGLRVSPAAVFVPGGSEALRAEIVSNAVRPAEGGDELLSDRGIARVYRRCG